MSFTENHVGLNEVIAQLERDSEVLSMNKDYIIGYIKFLAASNVSQARRKKALYNLKFWAKLLNKDFKKVNKEGMISAVSKINDDEVLATKGYFPQTEKEKKENKPRKIRQVPYQKSTKENMKSTLKSFYKWLFFGDNADKSQFPDVVRWIKIRLNALDKLPENLYTDDEILKLIKSSDSARNQALISILSETGMRAS